MRLCYASADFGIPVFGDKGASVHIQSMARSFMTLGHAVNMVAPQFGSAPLKFGAQLHRTKTALPEISTADLALAEHSDRVFKERRNLAIGRSVEATIIEQHAKTQFDFVYERYSLWSAAGARAAKRLGIPLVLEVNAPLLLEQQKYRQLVLSVEAEKIEAENFHVADQIYAVSHEVREYCISKGADPKRTTTLENGVDTEIFNPHGGSADTPFRAGLPVVGFAGSLKPWHGLEDLIQAVHLLHQSNIDCGLLLVGDGPMRGWIEGFAKGAGMAHLVHLTGWARHDEIPSYIRSMDVAAAPYPKLQDFYFSPLKLFEYLACGRAVVASDIGQISTVINHGENGILTEPGNPSILADRIASLLADPAMRKRLAGRAVQSMHGHSWVDCAAQVIEDVASLQCAPVKRSA